MMLTFFLNVGILPGSAQTPTESQVKAVFIFNFTYFVEWPSSAFADINSPFIIGVLGETEMVKALEETVRGETVKGRTIQILYFNNVSELKDSHILFVGSSKSDELVNILKNTSKATLTVSDASSFHDSGGMITFVKHGNKIRLLSNKTALDSSELQISSKLLRLTNVKE